MRQKRDKENERISPSRGTEGSEEGFQRQREKLQRGRRGGGLAMGERWQDIEVSGRKVRTSDRGRVEEEEKKKSSEQDSDTRGRQTESKMTG